MYDILGIGNAICDIIVKVEEDVLKKYNLEKGSMILCSEEQNSKILEELQDSNHNFTICSGGSAANTINYLSKYGVSAAFLGNVSTGFYGQKFTQELAGANIKFFNVNYETSERTAKCVILVTPDGERTMCTSLGCAAKLNLDKLDAEELTNCRYLYIEGYLWDHPETIDTINKLIDKAKTKGAKVIFSLSDPFCVDRHFADFKYLVEHKVDILFGNEHEIAALFEFAQDKEEENINKLASLMPSLHPQIVVSTRHDKGCIIFTKNNTYNIPTKKVKALDSTGAGDAFAAGFIFSTLAKLDIETSAQIANFVAGQVVQHIGARPNIKLPRNQEELQQAA